MFCSKFRAQIKALAEKITPAVVMYTEWALNITKVISDFLNNPIVIEIITLTPTSVDDVTRAAIIAALNKSIVVLDLVEDFKEDDPQKWEHLKTYLLSLPPIQKDLFLKQIASLIIKYLHNEQEKDSFYNAMAEGTFALLKVA